MTRYGSPANLTRGAVAVVGLLCAVAVWSVVHDSGAFTTYAGRNDVAATMYVAAGLGLIAAGLFASSGRLRVGVLAVLAGFIWFSPVWDGWEAGPPIVRELGMLASSFGFPILLHLVVVAARRLTHITRVLVGTTYALAGLSAVVLALVRDPYLDPHCWVNCATTLLVVSPHPGLASSVTTASLWITVIASVALVAACVSWSSLASSRRRHGPVLLGGALLALATAAHSLVTIRHGFEDPDSRSLMIAFLASCCAALLIAGGLVWSPLYARRVRREVADVVTNLHDVAGVGSLESALVVATSDPNLRVSYWLPALGMYSDAHGRPVREPSTGDGTVATQVMRDGERIAVISQTGDATELERVLGSDLRLALDNERLQAEVLAQMSDLRDSRARIIEAGDEGRRRLERDLHDGAQQSLLGLSYELRVARTGAATKPDDELTALLDSAIAQVGQAFAELRELAHGIFPAELTQAGLGPAIASLAETSEIPVELNYDVIERLPTAVETAVYVLVADGLLAATESLATSTTVTIGRRDGHVVVNVVPDRADVFTDMARATDRVGAIGGTLHIDAAGLRAEIPCAL